MPTVRGHLSDPLHKQSYLLLGAAGSTAATGFIFWILAARHYDTGDVGRAAGLVSAIALLNFLTNLGLPYGILRFLGTEERPLSLVVSALLVSAGSSFIGGVFFVLGSSIWVPELAELLNSPSESFAFIAFGIAVALGLLLDNVFASRRLGEVALARGVAMSVGKLVLILLLIDFGAKGIFWAMFVPVALATVTLLLLLPRSLGTRINVEGLHPKRSIPMLRFSTQNYPASLMMGAASYLLPLIVLGIEGAEANAVFYVAWNVALVLNLVPSIVSHLSLSEGVKSEPWLVARKARRFVLVLLSPAVIFTWILASPVLGLFGGEYAREAAWPMRILVLAAIPWAIVNIGTSALRVEDRIARITLTSGALAVSTLALSTLLLPTHGLVGAAWGWLIGVSIASVAAWPITEHRT